MAFITIGPKKLLIEITAAEQAHQMGLVYKGGGAWGHAISGETVAQTIDGKLVKVTKDADKSETPAPTKEVPPSHFKIPTVTTAPVKKPVKMAAKPATTKPNAKVAALMHKKVGEQKGSNPGGLYQGTDGKFRYIKQYKTAKRAQVEHLTSNIYNALGIAAPQSQAINTANGGGVYASVFIQGNILNNSKMTKDLASKILEGFAADVLLANWDVIGTGNTPFDNILVTPDGTPVRIDNGGAMMFRGMESNGEKPESVWYRPVEWTGFFGPKAPHYKEVLAAAGVTKPDDMAASLIQQITNIQKLEHTQGGWHALVKKFAPEMAPEDQEVCANMLEARSHILYEKIPELQANTTPTQPITKDEKAYGISKSTVLGAKIGEAKGTNEGGVYLGKDGVERYVKFYKDKSRPYIEKLATEIYRKLKLGGPNTIAFPDGTFASTMLDGKTLNELGGEMTVPIAKWLIQGFAADILTANWDAVGTGLDNILYESNLDVPIRIDNGGCFMMRAMESSGRKPDAALYDIKEWDTFLTSNPYYSTIFTTLGLKSADELAGAFRAQMKKISEFVQEVGGFEKFVEDTVPDMPDEDKQVCKKMLGQRFLRLLEKAKQVGVNYPEQLKS